MSQTLREIAEQLQASDKRVCIEDAGAKQMKALAELDIALRIIAELEAEAAELKALALQGEKTK